MSSINWQWEIVQTMDKFYRYMSRERELLTTGFTTKEMLVKYRDNIRIDDIQVIKIMSDRYRAQSDKLMRSL